MWPLVGLSRRANGPPRSNSQYISAKAMTFVTKMAAPPPSSTVALFGGVRGQDQNVEVHSASRVVPVMAHR